MKLYSGLLVVVAVLGVANSQTHTARCHIVRNSGVSPIEGTILMTQQMDANITIEVDLMGFQTGTSLHGFHVHTTGDLGNNCSNAGGHYNPGGMTHGGPDDTVRHVGDLGNVQANNGVVRTTISDRLVSLFGEYTVIGRAFVVHMDEDDLGKGNWSDSNTTGHAGARMGCCIITNTTTSDGTSSATGSVWTTTVVWSRLVAILCFAAVLRRLM